MSSATPDSQVRWAVGGALAALAVLVVASLLIPAGRHQWAVSFVRQPTPTTSLAFTHPTALPSSAKSGDPVTLAFTVANHEGRDQHYQYVVTSQSPGQTPALVARGSVAVADGTAQSVVRDVVPQCTGSSCVVQVALPEQSVLIDVRLDLHASAH